MRKIKTGSLVLIETQDILTLDGWRPLSKVLDSFSNHNETKIIGWVIGANKTRLILSPFLMKDEGLSHIAYTIAVPLELIKKVKILKKYSLDKLEDTDE